MSASQPLRVSARTLAEFTYFQPDITPSSLAALQAGTKGHLNRQSQAEGRAEVPIFWQGEAEGLPFLVSGRIDLLQDAETPPVVEEIKLCQGDAPPAPHPAHLAQALCYAFMLAEVSRTVIQESYDMAALTHETYTKQYAAGAASDWPVMVILKSATPKVPTS